MSTKPGKVYFSPTRSGSNEYGRYETTDIIFTNQDYFYKEINDPYFENPVVDAHVYLPFIKTYYEREAKEFGVDLTININMPEPIRVNDVMYHGFNADYQTRTAVNEFFTQKAVENGFSLTPPDLYVFVLLNPKRDPNNNYHAFRSFSERYEGKAFIDYNTRVDNISESTRVAIHEIGHLFNADDSYGKSSTFAPCEYPDGFPEPNKEPLYPQNAMCLMCPRFMSNEKGGPKTSEELDHYHSIVDQDYTYEYMQVCIAEATRFGWK